MEYFPLLIKLLCRSFVRRKTGASELGRRPAFGGTIIRPHPALGLAITGPPTRSILILLSTTLADILSSFDMKKFLYINRFSSHKKPNIFTVLTYLEF